MTDAVRFAGITKRFPGVQALSDVSLSVAAGSCHALCGENGAGKSTLGKILAGVYTPDNGHLFVGDREVRFDGPRDALAAGVGMVHQELAFCDNLTVAENLCLGALPSRAGFVNRRERDARAAAMLAEIGADIDVTRRLGELPIAQQQVVQIAVAVGGGAQIIVFDEPTSSLSQPEAERLYSLIDRLKARGVTCIYVSHRMPEVYRLCDTITVLRDGRHVATRAAADLPEHELVQLMIGRPLSEYLPQHHERGSRDELLRVEHLSFGDRFQDISFSLCGGEIVGLAGLVGAGRSDVASALFGIVPATEGRVFVRGREERIGTPRDAIRLELGLVPEDRKRQGLVQSESGRRNVSLPILDRLSTFGWLHQSEERALTREYFQLLRVRTPDIDARVAGLSGGNQQKIVLARWLAARSRILILDEPTRGVDVGAKAEIHALVAELARQGAGVLLISSELPELLALSTRILVLRAGRLVAEMPAGQATQDGLLRAMAGIVTSDRS
ncbi:MAG: sugar ABC transporter ATP-binding protein [Gemmatimonadaceae bacterium]